jgi:hypothetical protein
MIKSYRDKYFIRPEFVIQKLESGAHGSAADVISVALHVLQKHDEAHRSADGNSKKCGFVN